MDAKEAFESVCLDVADYYVQNGWMYLKSKHSLKLLIEDIEFKIYFYSSVRNVSNVSVDFYGECAIQSHKEKCKYFTVGNSRYHVPKEGLWWNVAQEQGRIKAAQEFKEWSQSVIMPLVTAYRQDRDEFVKKVAYEGFVPELGWYYTDIGFVLEYGGKELAQAAALKYYESLETDVKENFKVNYLSMIEGGEAVTKYGSNMMRNRSNFKIIIENKIAVDV